MFLREKCVNYRDTAVSKNLVKAQKREPSRPIPFRGKRAENCSHNVGQSLGEGLG